MSFGITVEGFELKTLRDILGEIETDERAEIDPAIDTSAQSPTGQHNAVFSRQHAQVWEVLQKCHDGLDRDKAEGDQLIALCKLTGTVPNPATFSRVGTTCNLNAGTTLVAGVSFASINGKPEELWTPLEDFTAPTTGNHAVTFRAAVAGPMLANAATLTVIATTTPGWNSITNALDAIVGAPADTDETLRTRQEQELAASGSSTARAIRADILQIEIDGVRPVKQCAVLENDTDLTDPVTGLPPHSLEAVVHDEGAVSNDVIAQTIWDTKGGGITMIGALSGNAVDAETGEVRAIKFSRPTEVNVWVTFEGLVTGPSYPGLAAFKSAVVSALRTNITVGAAVTELACWLAAGNVAGVLRLGAVKLGFAVSPTGTDDLTLSARQIAAFDTTRISVT